MKRVQTPDLQLCIIQIPTPNMARSDLAHGLAYSGSEFAIPQSPKRRFPNLPIAHHLPNHHAPSRRWYTRCGRARSYPRSARATCSSTCSNYSTQYAVCEPPAPRPRLPFPEFRACEVRASLRLLTSAPHRPCNGHRPASCLLLLC